MLTRDEFKAIYSLMHDERNKLRSRGIEWDVADVMGVLDKFVGEDRKSEILERELRARGLNHVIRLADSDADS